MQGQGDSWPHQVEIEMPRNEFDARLRAIEAWLTEWEMPHRIGSTLAGASGSLRVHFAEAKFARAFVSQHGGRPPAG